MMFTVADALEYAPKAWALLTKLYNIITSGTPQDVDEEIKALEAARLRPSADIIAEADQNKG